MNHAQAQALIFQKLDAPLTPGQDAALAEHLAGCEECRALWLELSQLDAALADTELTPPAALHSAVMQRVRAQKKKRVPHPFRLAAAAVLALLLGLGGFYFSAASGDGQASVSVGSAADSALNRFLRADDRKFARSFAAGHAAQVLAVWTDEVPQQVRARSPVQEENGALVYAADAALLDTLCAQETFTSERFGDAEAETAYLIVFPE